MTLKHSSRYSINLKENLTENIMFKNQTTHKHYDKTL